MGVDREAGFVGREVEGDNAAAAKTFHELRGGEAVVLIEVAEGAEDDARFNAGGPNA